jgi:hypothetical protein
MKLTDFFEEVRDNLRGHDGTHEGKLKYYETQLLKGKSLDNDQKREYLENKGVGNIDPNDLTFEEVVKPLPKWREKKKGYSPDGHSLLYLWTTQKYLRHLPNNLDKIPRRFFTKEALLEPQSNSKQTVLYNLYRYKKEHLVPEEMKTEEFLTSNRWNKGKPLHVIQTILGELIEVAGIRAIPDNLRTEEFLMKNRGGNYFTLVATQGDLLKMPQSTITLENLTKNKTVNDESLLYICGKYGQLNDLPKDFYNEDNLNKYKKDFIEALCATCSSTNPSATKEGMPKELLTKEYLEAPQGHNLPNAIQAATVANKIDLIPPKIFADNLFYTNDWSTYFASKGSKGTPLDLLTENGSRPLNPKTIPHFKKVLEHVDKTTLKKVEENYQTLLPLIKEEQKRRIQRSIDQMSENALSI